MTSRTERFAATLCRVKKGRILVRMACGSEISFSSFLSVQRLISIVTYTSGCADYNTFNNDLGASSIFSQVLVSI